MALEMELKYLDADLDDLAVRLKEEGGTTSGPYFESNLVFDDEDRSLKQAGTLLRLREKKGVAVLTVKKKPENQECSALKVFEEIESEVADHAAVKAMLEAVGFRVAFGYEKVREKWRFMDCVICLDWLPFGNFVEIEGNGETVPACARKLGLDGNPTTKSTYHALNLEYREQNGLDPNESFLFAEEEKPVLIRQLEKD